ncbi:5-hydroxytryptamine receptor 3A-like [Halichoeres trimaculatus]|uniref:5-hydroxytryptamine receptor 3A-like n=1 Tax=Halichoeres trimaculatus TaxID=147232 RepID=UPI003D9DC526
MFPGILFLLLLTAGSISSQPDLQDLADSPLFNSSFDEDGSTFFFSSPPMARPNFYPKLHNPSNNTDFTSGEESCNKSHWDIIQHLNLKEIKDKLTLIRPTRDSKKATEVYLDLLLYAILDVKEKEQKFVSYIWVDMWWFNDLLRWDADEYCGINSLPLPTKLLWQPDITVEERTEKDKATQSPYIHVQSNGSVLLRNDMVLVTICKMQVYKFPFDTQSCALSFKSVIHGEEEMVLLRGSDKESTREWSHDMIRTQSDWLFIDIESTNKTVNNFYITQSVLSYTITMKRRPILYVVNFILPVLLFLCLDLASFMISERGGEKLGFKVTVLLAVTVMQLILNDILPSSSDRIPLIAIYCIGIFGLMMLSLLETMLVMYLLERDSELQDNEAGKDQSLGEDLQEKTDKARVHICLKDVGALLCCDRSSVATPRELLPAGKQPIHSPLTEETHDFETEVLKALSLLLSSRNEEPGYWTRMTRKINRAFFIFYFVTAVVFLASMFHKWNEEDV